MGRGLSKDLRIRVVQACDGGLSARRAAERFGVAASTAIRWVARARAGELDPRPMGNRKGSRLDPHSAYILGLIEAQKDITLDEMVVRIAEERGVRIGRSALSNWLRRQGYTYKKRPLMHWSRSGPML